MAFLNVERKPGDVDGAVGCDGIESRIEGTDAIAE